MIFEIYKMSKKIIESVNYHFTRVCNYKCGFCFHTQKNAYTLPIEKAFEGLKLLKEYGVKKINFAGGEPFTNSKFLGELIKKCKEDLGIEKISIITNGSLVKEDFFKKFGKYIDVFGVSCDSFNKDTNKKSYISNFSSRIQPIACSRFCIRARLVEASWRGCCYRNTNTNKLTIHSANRNSCGTSKTK